MIKDRLVKLRSELIKKEVDAFLISQPKNRFYLSGFDGSDGYLLITAKNSIIATDFRYVEQVKRQCPDYTLFQITGKMAEWFPELIDSLSIKRLAFESGATTFAQYTQISEIIYTQKLPLELVPTENVVEKMRSIKEPEEIIFIEKAAEIGDCAFEYVTDRLKIGMTEKKSPGRWKNICGRTVAKACPSKLLLAPAPMAPYHMPSLLTAPSLHMSLL